jgi:hypothetical protein
MTRERPSAPVIAKLNGVSFALLTGGAVVQPPGNSSTPESPVATMEIPSVPSIYTIQSRRNENGAIYVGKDLRRRVYCFGYGSIAHISRQCSHFQV